MPNGYCPAILTHIEAITKCNPARKLSNQGFLAAVLNNMDDSVKAEINSGYDDGHVKGVSVAFRRRPLASEVSDTEIACDTALTPAKDEFSLPSLLTKSISFYVPNSLIRQYCKDSSERVVLDINQDAALNDRGETAVMKEVYDMLIEYGGALLANIDAALVTQQLTQFGTNVKTGAATATALDFAPGTIGMGNAYVRLMEDMRENEFCDDVYMVGNGPFSNMDLIRNWFSSQPGANGVNNSAMLNSFPKVYFDKNTRSIWGANQIGVFEKGSQGLITYNKYVKSFAGRIANTEFGTIALPTAEYCCPQEYLDRLQFDIKVREIDCPTTMTINGASTTVSEGVQITLVWRGSLWTRPTNLYKSGDPLLGTNGTLRYAITETVPA